MSGRKLLYLIFALVLPIGIFLFLKFFGKNEFQVEPLFQSQVMVDNECTQEYVFPYVIADSIIRQLEINDRAFTLVVFEQEEEKDEIEKKLKRIEEEFSSDSIQIKRILPSGINAHLLRRCVFLMDDEVTISLVDKSGRILGQYGTSLDDMDRLIVEMKIVLRKY